MRRISLRRAILVGAIVLAAAAGWAVEPLRVGDVYPITIDSTGQTGLTSVLTATGRVWELRHPGATYIALHFSRFDLGPGDQLFVSDRAGGQRALVTWRGTADDASFWARHVKGDTLRLEYVSMTLAPAAPRSAFAVDLYAAGFVDLGGGTEAICGTDDKRNAVCYAGGYPTEYVRAQAVARLLIRSRWLCTGWLVSPDSLLLTNEHCITSERDALNTDYEFAAEAPKCADPNGQLEWPGVIYDGSQFIRDNPALDYALIRLAGNPAASYGWLEIDDRPAVPTEEIYMPQHPGGFAREFGIEDSSVQSGLCEVATITAPACTGATYYSDVSYSCDTEGGSSGSPVLARSSHKVVALHHCGSGCTNTGVPIWLVYDEIAPYLPAPGFCGDGICVPPEDACSCQDDCGPAPTSETEMCADGDDNDCDGPVDCDDGDCVADPACAAPPCGDPGDPCSSGADCCSGKCVGKPGRGTCK